MAATNMKLCLSSQKSTQQPKAIAMYPWPHTRVFLWPNLVDGIKPAKEKIMVNKLTTYTAQITEIP